MLNKIGLFFGLSLALFFPVGVFADLGVTCFNTISYSWSGNCSNSCGIGTEKGSKVSASSCGGASVLGSVSRSCQGTSCSATNEKTNERGSNSETVYTVKTNKRDYSPGEAISVYWSGVLYACNNDSWHRGFRVRTSNGSAYKTLFDGNMGGTGNRNNITLLYDIGKPTALKIYSNSTTLTAPSAGGTYYVQASTRGNGSSWSGPSNWTRFTVTNPCTPSCSCASNTCVGTTCSDGCGGTCSGTKADTSWTPASSTYCSGYSYTQTGSPCGSSRSETGTKTCQPSYCNTATSPYLYCSGNNLMGVYSYWNNTGCSVSTCQGYWDYNSCGTFTALDCGGDTCNTGGAEYEYCQDGNIWGKYDGTSQGCTSAACYNNHRYCNHYEKEVCEVGKTCAITGTDDAECVNKAATWSEE